jgi:nitrite reductase/ring-hydroxylating ferredoxin subunit
MSAHAVEVADLAQVPAGTSVRVTVADTRIALFHPPWGLWAIEDGCVHCAASLVGGRIDDDVMTCPSCGWKYGVPGGALVRLPAIRLATFPVRIENVRILLEWSTAARD